MIQTTRKTRKRRKRLKKVKLQLLPRRTWRVKERKKRAMEMRVLLLLLLHRKIQPRVMEKKKKFETIITILVYI